MANPEVTFFQDDSAVTSRTAEETNDDASWVNGMNLTASCAPGIGINQGGGAVVGTPEQFTLLDQGRPVESGGSQTPTAREAQLSQLIGGGGFVARTGNVVTTWDKSQALYTDSGAASSGGDAGALPEDVIQFGDAPTQAEKDADPALDGTVITVGNSTLSDLAVGWTVEAP